MLSVFDMSKHFAATLHPSLCRLFSAFNPSSMLRHPRIQSVPGALPRIRAISKPIPYGRKHKKTSVREAVGHSHLQTLFAPVTTAIFWTDIFNREDGVAPNENPATIRSVRRRKKTKILCISTKCMRARRSESRARSTSARNGQQSGKFKLSYWNKSTSNH